MSALLGNYIRERRASLGLGQAELGDAAGLTKSHMSQIEAGKIALPSADVRRSLAKALGVSHLDILVAAGEITRDELGSVAGVVEVDPCDPKQRLHQAIDTTPMTEDRVLGLLQMLEAWRAYSRRTVDR